MNQEIRTRPMVEADIEAVQSLAAGLPDAPDWDLKAYTGAIARARVQQGIALVAGDSDSDLCGFVVGGLVIPEAEIELIAVRGESQRQGIARRLLDAFAGESRRLGCDTILLEVRPSNAGARAFYSASGFAETGRRPAYYADPVEDAILMSWTIK
ncbi:ribosomal protein S18-alanine N-acetyltransferase [Occallatibacter riparius]|uniref:[Ribosomal protein bS18]-alanine N-acetyltransferase n=1 Tax=Occallatibacter riparius TaxID=1002689 RepID=A0A9J7BVV1_9BACT|nr:ribosomal protein S18-alanine N-acetyltransferase [Occallatibacter riparius]UWZ86768.1 ribosomal protein S18-alanine N-acetyltransferase [Occallatibacter riparius]